MPANTKIPPQQKGQHVPDIFGEQAIAAIKAVKPGEILVWKRSIMDQEDVNDNRKAEQTEMIKTLPLLITSLMMHLQPRLHVSLVSTL